jgi:putative ABC transport system permease protein
MKLALRQLAKSPGFTFVAIATLALGIGACTAMFSIVRAVILKPLPFHEPERLVWIENDGTGGLSARTSRSDTVNGWREQNQSFEALGALFAFSDYGTKVMSVTGNPERVRDVAVSDNFFDVLGVRPLLGRNFTPAECAWQAPGAAILSHAFWQQRFAGDAGVIGRTITINNQAVTVVGVLPRTFDFDAIFTPGNEVDLVVPFPLVPETARWGNTVFGIGRLRAGVTAAQAQADLDVINGRLRETLPSPSGIDARVTSLSDSLRGKFRGAFSILTGAVACVLAIACVNLSNLLLARLNARRQEFAVRISLGAQRWHLVRQTLSESLLLAFAGALLGLPVAMWATEGLARMQTFGVPLLQDAAVDPVALAVTVAVTTLAGIACGLLPALHVSRTSASAAMQQQATHQRTAGRSASAARNVLVVAEVALACVLLVGAGLLIRSFNAVLKIDLGFEPQHALSWRLATPRNFNSLAEINNYFDGLVARVAALPGVTAVGLTDTLPLSRNRTWGAGVKNVEYPPEEYPTAFPRMIDRQYLQAMNIPLRRGRLFDGRDTADGPKTIIINESLARFIAPEGDPLGMIIDVQGGSTVIGVVADVRHSALEESGGFEMYLDYHQIDDWGALDLVVRSTRPAEALVPEVRAVLAAYDPTLPSGEFHQLDRLVDNAVAPRRLITQLLGAFSTLALTLAALGLYGVIAYSVAQRTQEIGIRMAIGAQRGDVLKLILRGGLQLVALGVVLGLGGAFALTRIMQAMLFGVTAHDPFVFGSIAGLLLAVATAACLLPALRATKVDPLTALRAE